MTNNKNLRYGSYPFCGAVLGAGTGLIITKGTTVGLAGVAVIGTSGIRLIGLGVSMVRGSKKTHFPKKIHFSL